MGWTLLCAENHTPLDGGEGGGMGWTLLHEKSCIPKQEGESGVHFGSC